jgi:hypothetical protein
MLTDICPMSCWEYRFNREKNTSCVKVSVWIKLPLSGPAPGDCIKIMKCINLLPPNVRRQIRRSARTFLLLYVMFVLMVVHDVHGAVLFFDHCGKIVHIGKKNIQYKLHRRNLNSSISFFILFLFKKSSDKVFFSFYSRYLRILRYSMRGVQVQMRLCE